MKEITVNAQALGELLGALVGPPHLMRELQVTRGPLVGKDNPINILVAEYNAAAEQFNSEAQELPVCETDLQIIYGGDKPHGIRDKSGFLFFFTGLTQYPNQEARFTRELDQQRRLADHLLKSLQSTIKAQA